MMSTLRMLVVVSCVVACGGTNPGEIYGLLPQDAATGADTGAAPIGDAGQRGDGGSVADNGGTVSFMVGKTYFTRGSWCGSPPPFQSTDVFTLTLDGPGSKQPLPRIQITVWATAPLNVPRSLTVQPWKPGPPPLPGQNDINPEQSNRTDVHGKPELAFSLSRGTTPKLPNPNAYDQATLTVLAIPTRQGETLEVRVQLHFTDGATLDQTFISPLLVEKLTACGGGLE